MRIVRSIAKRLTAALLLVCVFAAMYSLSAFAASSERVVKKNSKGVWVCVKDGKVEKSYTGMAHNKFGWWRIKKGVVDFNATGVCSNEYGWFYVPDSHPPHSIGSQWHGPRARHSKHSHGE